MTNEVQRSLVGQQFSQRKRTFSLRDLFWLVLVVGLALAWWADRRNVVSNRDKLLDAIQAAGWQVEMEEGEYRLRWPGKPTARPSP